MNKDARIHGVLACSGNGSRFAKSIGEEPPYPKHLEVINGQTILQRAIDSMVRLFNVQDVTITLNSLLIDEYIPELHSMQNAFPAIPLSIIIKQPNNTKDFPYDQIALALLLGECLDLDRKSKDVNQEGKFVIAPGDQFVDPRFRAWDEFRHGFMKIAQELPMDRSAVFYSPGDGLRYFMGELPNLLSEASMNEFPIDLNICHINSSEDLEDSRRIVLDVESPGIHETGGNNTAHERR